mmetsp:Transcript_556/g.1711  ORF Transcript_556/g.1711 Transcript_556/m.1711 type:complete len:238 (-) Transcript_556:1159-1872(-)
MWYTFLTRQNPKSHSFEIFRFILLQPNRFKAASITNVLFPVHRFRSSIFLTDNVVNESHVHLQTLSVRVLVQHRRKFVTDEQIAVFVPLIGMYRCGTNIGNSREGHNQLRKAQSIADVFGVIPILRPGATVLGDHDLGKAGHKGRRLVQFVPSMPDAVEERVLEFRQLHLHEGCNDGGRGAAASVRRHHAHVGVHDLPAEFIAELVDDLESDDRERDDGLYGFKWLWHLNHQRSVFL